MKKKTETRADLQRRIAELTAQLSSTYHFASAELDKAGKDRMGASAVMVTLTALGGRQIICPVAIRNGLSADTIEALRRDIVRSWEESIELKPKR